MKENLFNHIPRMFFFLMDADSDIDSGKIHSIVDFLRLNLVHGSFQQKQKNALGMFYYRIISCSLVTRRE